MPNWGTYNGYYPVIPTSVGLELGDGVGLVDYSVTNADGVAVYQCKVPVFFGLVNAGFGNLWRWVRGLTVSQTAGEKTEVFVASPCMLLLTLQISARVCVRRANARSVRGIS
ncbi:hypothetical protein FMN12_22295 [Bacteroides acidifaciens]|uniref:hypothetical protein n=1 Tax=Bacteroides acidifaciens TaxID=85831 RepID=UPI00138F0F09|nr:hypothetical protein [Bacteroides acidifaciens]NDO56409.1 hypothetical protein [Bacteroides acidifaciens]